MARRGANPQMPEMSGGSMSATQTRELSVGSNQRNAAASGLTSHSSAPGHRILTPPPRSCGPEWGHVPPSSTPRSLPSPVRSFREGRL